MNDLNQQILPKKNTQNIKISFYIDCQKLLFELDRWVCFIAMHEANITVIFYASYFYTIKETWIKHSINLEEIQRHNVK